MPRIPRRFTLIKNSFVHKIWTTHNKENYLGKKNIKSLYLRTQQQDMADKRFSATAKIHAFAIMGNHVHEMFFIESPEGFSAHMRRHHSRFGFMFNKAHKRCGKVARDRAKTILIENDSHAMQACFYIHANPIKHGFVKDLRQYPYTSHDLYAYGKRNEYNKHVELPSWYQRLGKTVVQEVISVIFKRAGIFKGICWQEGFI